ncbi:MAG: LamG-like jellyroll fold domain-containing protein [Limisphaerales bacterium]
MTLEFWVAIGAIPTWGRLFDFGDTEGGNGQDQIDCAPNDGFSPVGFDFEVPGYTDAPLPPLANWSGHLVCVFNPGQYLAIYTNGVLMAMNSSVPAAMSALNTTHSYLGRSSWNGDPNGVETIDEFRLYDGVMAPNQVAADYAAGPSNNIAVFGSLTGLHLSIPSPVDTDQATPLQVTVTADFQNAKGVNLTIANPALKPANTNVLDYVGNLTLRIVGAGATEVVASYGGLSATQSVTVVQSPLTLTHRYSFNESAGSTNFVDSIGGADGTVFGAASLDGAGHLVLPGGDGGNSVTNDNYAALPPHLIDDYTAVTIEFWVAIGATPTWGRLFDFGDTDSSGNGRTTIDCAPNSGLSPVGVNLEVGGALYDSPAPPLVNWTGHLVFVFDPAKYLAIYTNGVLFRVTTPTAETMSAINSTHSYLGRSSWMGDPNGVQTIDELRIYNGAMGPWQVAADYAAGPNTLPAPQPSLSIVKSGGNILLSWPAPASGYSVQTTSRLGAASSWGAPAGNPSPVSTNGTFQVTLPIGAQPAFYRLAK